MMSSLILSYTILQFLIEIENLFNEEEKVLIKYNGDSIGQFCELFNANMTFKESLRINSSLSSISIEMLRLINRVPISDSQKQSVVEKLIEIDNILIEDGHFIDYSISTEQKEKIEKKVKYMLIALKEYYGVAFKLMLMSKLDADINLKCIGIYT